MAENAFENEKWDGDLLNRKQYASFLTDYLKTKDNGFVLNIDAPWGSGKTFFIDHWHNDVSKQHPTVKFNAWTTDFSNDPLLSFLSCIKSQLLPKLNRIHKSDTAMLNLFNKGFLLAKEVFPGIVKGAVQKAIGSEGLEALSNISLEDEKNISDIFEKTTSKLILANRAIENTISSFRGTLKTLIAQLTSDNTLAPPLFIFIDELDRCRPLYAIELLERIKHLFDVSNVVFVVSTDTEQLSHSIKAVYGNDFEARIYLKRFFNQSYSLPQAKQINYTETLFANHQKGKDNKYYDYKIMADGSIPPSLIGNGPYTNSDEFTLKTSAQENVETILIFALFAEFFKLDLRTLNQCYERISAILATFKKNEEIHFAHLTFLVMLQANNLSYYQRYFHNRVSNSDTHLEYILNSYNSRMNIRSGTKICYASQIIRAYNQQLFLTPVELKNLEEKAHRHKPNSDAGIVTSKWLLSIHNNYSSIMRYQNKVDLACDIY